MTTAFVDGDIILYQAASFCEDEFEGEPIADSRQGEALFDNILKSWLSGIDYDDFYLCFTLSKNFRKDIYPEYKQNRKNFIPPPVLRPLKNRLLDYEWSLVEDGIEADDLIGIICTGDPDNTVAVTLDKDFLTLPCQLFLANKPKDGVITIDESKADLTWMRQTMTGDTVDNYKGIPGVGPKKAEKLLPEEASLRTMWRKVEANFRNHGLPAEHALTCARLARILRDGDYNFDTRKVNLWSPPE